MQSVPVEARDEDRSDNLECQTQGLMQTDPVEDSAENLEGVNMVVSAPVVGSLAQHQALLRQRWVQLQASTPRVFHPDVTFHRAYQSAVQTLREHHSDFITELQADLDKALSLDWRDHS
eukprot:5945541-Amphidinium_carterae.1